MITTEAHRLVVANGSQIFNLLTVLLLAIVVVVLH
jgi:hypothetical protein